MNIEIAAIAINAVVNDRLVYLAGPYTHDDPTVEQYRFLLLTRAAADLTAAGLHVFSPITHSHPLAQMRDLPRDWDFWGTHDELFLDACGGIIVLNADGWDHSIGVGYETTIARRTKKPQWEMMPAVNAPWPSANKPMADQPIEWSIS